MNELMDGQKEEDIEEIDNSRLEELMSIEPGQMTDDDKKEFLELLKKSTLYIPVQWEKEEVFDMSNQNVEVVIKPVPPLGFNLISLSLKDGERTVVAFTRKEIFKEIGLKTDFIPISMKSLAGIILGYGDTFSSIMINPQTEHSIMINIYTFLNLFKEKPDDPFIGSLKQSLAMFEEKSIELDKHYMFFLRSEYELFQSESKDGIFTAKMPLAVSSNENYQANLPILQKIMMTAGQKIVYTGAEENNEKALDVLIAPGSEFEKFYDEDGDTSVWRCVKQPFYDE